MAYNVNQFNQNNNYGQGKKQVDRQYSSFSKPYSLNATGDMGTLIPILAEELTPSQKIKIWVQIAMQFFPFVSNFMGEIYGEIKAYFVPFRLIWNQWETFYKGGIDGQDKTAHPTIDLSHLYRQWVDEDPTNRQGKPMFHTVADYLGMPLNPHILGNPPSNDHKKPSAFYHWAYNKIYNEHIRIPDIEPTEVDINNNFLLYDNWDWDYFTRARIFQMRGVSPTVPISDELEQLEHKFYLSRLGVMGKPTADNIEKLNLKQDGSTKNMYIKDGEDQNWSDYLGDADGVDIQIKPHEMTAFGMDIRNFLIAKKIMSIQVTNAKIQDRYVDHLYIRFGVNAEDFRLQRPEYLGSRTFGVGTDIVTQTSAGGQGQTPQGNITGQAWGSGDNMSYEYEAKEHGILMILMTVKPKPSYSGGLHKKFIKESRFDYIFPELADLPDVPVHESELFYNNQTKDNDEIFGWQGIYEPYRTNINIVAGKLRPELDQTLKSYTLARFWEETGKPRLNKEFMKCRPDEARLKQYLNEPMFTFFVRNSINTSMPIPMQSDPNRELQSGL